MIFYFFLHKVCLRQFLYLVHSFYLNLRYYICKIFGNLPQKGTFLAILVGKKMF